MFTPCYTKYHPYNTLQTCECQPCIVPYPLLLRDQKQIMHPHHPSPLLAELLLSSLPKPILVLPMTASAAAVYELQASCCFCC